MKKKKKKKQGGWTTHKKAVKGLERMFGVPLKKVDRSGTYLVELDIKHPLGKKLSKKPK